MSYFDTIYADTLLPHRAFPVYMYLKDRSGSTGSCWPGIKTRYRPNGSNTSNLYTLL